MPAALPISLEPSDTISFNNFLVAASRRSFVTRVEDPEDKWSARATERLPTTDPIEEYRAWGRIDGHEFRVV